MIERDEQKYYCIELGYHIHSEDLARLTCSILMTQCYQYDAGEVQRMLKY